MKIVIENIELNETANNYFVSNHINFSFDTDWEIILQGVHPQDDQTTPLTKSCNRIQFLQHIENLYRFGIHGIEHSYRVLKLVQQIANLEKLEQSTKQLLEFCAIFHDIGRVNDDIDNLHGVRSVKKLERYDFFGLDFFNIPLTEYIIENHCINDKTAFRNVRKYVISNFNEAIYLLKVFKDADNLDRVRLGDFDSNYLRLSSSFQLINDAKVYFRNKNNSSETINIFQNTIISFLYKKNTIILDY